jgi:hypothetical protein
MNYSKLCEKVLELDPKIRFAGICNDNGETLYGGQRKGVEDLLSRKETKESNLQVLAMWGLRHPLTTKVGRGKYTMTEFERLKQITVPLDDDHLLVVTTEVESCHDEIIKSILKLL